MHLRLPHRSWFKSHFSITRITPVGVAAVCLVLLFVGFTQYQRIRFQATKGAAPVAYWKLDEGVGTTIIDSVSTNHGNIGNNVSTPTWKSKDDCISGSCLWFDGTNDMVGITSSAGIATNTVTVSFWMRSPPEVLGTGWNIVIAKGNGAQGWYLGRVGTASDLWIRVDTSGGFNQYDNKLKVLNVFDNKWHYITYVINHSTSKLKSYKDGILTGTAPYNPGTGVGNNSIPLQIGFNSAATVYTKGYIDDVKLYDYERTADQIKQDYAGTGSVYGESAHIGSDNHMGSLSNGLVGYWKMDETSWNGTAGEVKDSSGNDNNGTSSSSPGSVAGKFGKAGSFSGGSHMGNINGDNNSLDITDQFTLSAWIKPSSLTGYAAVLSKWAIGAKQYKLAATLNGDGKPYLDVTTDDNTDIYLQSSQAITTTRFYHLVGVYKGGTNPFMKLYIDGVDVSGTMTGGTVPSAITSNAQLVRIATDGNNPYTGIIDDVRVYNRALDPSEVKALYGWAPGPVAYYPMDEGVGNTLVYDKSGNGYNLVMDPGMSGSQWVSGKYGNAVHFRGDDTADQLYSDTWINNLPTSDMSVGFWMYWEDNGVDLADVPIGKRGANMAWYLTLNEVNQSIEMDTDFDGTDGFYRSSFGVVPFNQWTYVYVTWDATLKRPHFYINGKETGYTSTTPATGNYVDDSANTFRIADDNETFQVFPGIIDDVRIYNYGRTLSQIKEDMNGGHPFGGSPVGSQAGYWKFNEANGDSAYDSSSYGLTGNLAASGTCPGTANCPAWTTDGKQGSALSFDGTNDYVYVGPSIDLSGTTPMSLSAWINLTDIPPSSDRKIVSKYNDGVEGEWYLAVDSTAKVSFVRECGAYGTVSSSTLSAGRWYHVAGVYDGTDLKIYINGKLNKTKTDACGITSSGADVFIGADDQNSTSQRNFKGLIDEVKIYAGALSDSQILIDYNMGNSMTMGALSTLSDGTTPSNSTSRSYCIPGDTSSCSPPIGEWKMDENAGTVSTADSSGYGNTATFNGSITGNQWTQGRQGSALSFDGANDYIQADHATLYDMGTSTPFTITGWFKSNAPGVTQNILMAVNNTSNYYRVQVNGGFLRVQLVDSAGSTFCTIRNNALTVDDGRWHYFAGLFNRNASCTTSDILIYIDGQKQTTTVANTGLLTNVNLDESGIRIGGNSAFFSGPIDTIRLYNYILTPAQISWEYNHGAPTGWYKMNECTGSTIGNWAPQSDTGNLAVGATLNLGALGVTSAGTCTTSGAWFNGATGKLGASMSFDGTDDYISLGNTAFGNLYDNHSVSVWVKTGAANGTIISQYQSAVCGAAVFSVFNGKPDFDDGSGSTFITGNKSINDNLWHNVVFVSDTNNSYIYVDGILDKSSTDVDWTNGCFTTDVRIGSRVGSNYYSGLIDDLRVYRYSLTPAQIKTVMSNGTVSFQ